jgi:hypothetical protein
LVDSFESILMHGLANLTFKIRQNVMNSRAIATVAFRKTKAFVTSKYDLNFRKKSVKCYN